MWVMTRLGFYSVACADKPGRGGAIDPDTVMVRARISEHLENLKERFGYGKTEFPIKTSQETDYRFRIMMPKVIWVNILMQLAEEQTWRNFKNEAERFGREHKQSRRYVDALHDVWRVMLSLQLRDGEDKTIRNGGNKLTHIKDMQQDPEPLDTSKAEVQQEMFEQYNSHGLRPEDLPGMKPALRKKYAKWLESQRA